MWIYLYRLLTLYIYRGTDALLHSVSAPRAKLVVLGRLSSTYQCGGFPKMGVPQNGWFILDNHIKMDDLGGTPPILGNPYTTWVSTPSGEIVTSSYVVTGQSHLPDNCIIAGLGFRHL